MSPRSSSAKPGNSTPTKIWGWNWSRQPTPWTPPPSICVNQRYGRSGHLWQNRFFSCGLDRDHLVTALAYVDLNPVRAGMVGSAQEYSWSSARAHVEEEDALGLIDFSLWRQVRGRDDWAASLSRPPDADATRRLREATQRGVPLGSEDFVETLEQSTGRCLALRGPGRPPRRKARQAHAG